MRNNVDCSTHLLLLMSYAEEQKLCFECLKIELNKSYRRKLIVWKKFFGAMLSGEGGGGGRKRGRRPLPLRNYNGWEMFVSPLSSKKLGYHRSFSLSILATNK